MQDFIRQDGNSLFLRRNVLLVR